MNRIPHLTEQIERHLSDEQLCCLLEDSTGVSTSTRLHFGSCIACQTEFATLRASLSNFRAAATGYAAAEPPTRRRVVAVSPKTSWMPHPVWAASFASAVAVLGVSLSLMHPHPVTRVAQTPVTTAAAVQPEVSDEALLDGIQRDLSTSVPPSLEPLEVSATTGAGNLHN